MAQRFDAIAIRKQIDDLIQLCGEDDFADMVEHLANDRLKVAVSRLMASEWWINTMKLGMANATQINTTLLCKLLDKAVPTQQAVKLGADEGFKLVIEHVDTPRKAPDAS